MPRTARATRASTKRNAAAVAEGEPAPRSKKARSDAAPAAAPAPARVRRPPPPKRTDARGKAVAFVPYATSDVWAKIERAKPGSGHRIFLISREKQNEQKETFTVLGAKADVYTVVIGRHPSCNCADARIRRTLCKHHMFVMLRVLGLDQHDPLVWQHALTEMEARKVLGGALDANALGGVLADDAVRRAYLEMSGRGQEVAPTAEPVKQRPLDSDACPICFDALAEEEQVVFCICCGNNVHEQCFQMWSLQRKAQGADPVCVFCRAPWPAADKKTSKKPSARRRRGPARVVNLLNVSQAHQAADLSSRALYGNRRYDDVEEYEDEDDEGAL